MNRLARIRFTAGRGGEGYQETGASGELVALYDAEGDQLGVGNAEWEIVREIGEIEPDDADAFWAALEGDGVEARCP